MTFTFRTTLLLMILTAFATIPQSFATPKESITTTIKDKSISLYVQPHSEDQLLVQLYDLSGEILMSEEFNAKEISKRIYNLKNLPKGKYILEIEDEYKVYTKNISIIKNKITFTEEKSMLKPVFYKKDYVWTLSVLTFGEDATIMIYDDNGKEIFTESHYGEQSISRKYNMSGREAGEYKLKVFVGNKSFADLMVII